MQPYTVQQLNTSVRSSLCCTCRVQTMLATTQTSNWFNWSHVQPILFLMQLSVMCSPIAFLVFNSSLDFCTRCNERQQTNLLPLLPVLLARWQALCQGLPTWVWLLFFLKKFYSNFSLVVGQLWPSYLLGVTSTASSFFRGRGDKHDTAQTEWFLLQ